MLALAANRQAHGTEAGADSVDFFVAHHLEEMSKGYWLEQLATATPDVAVVIELLVFRSSWGKSDLECHIDWPLSLERQDSLALSARSGRSRTAAIRQRDTSPRFNCSRRAAWTCSARGPGVGCQ